MKPIEAVFDALGKLTYAEMLELACYLRDTAEGRTMNIGDASEWADVLNSCREGWAEREV